MLEERLAERPFLLADGATGTNLFEMGLVSGEAPELWLEAHPDRVMALHQSFVDAGADIILTNSFGGNARRLMLHDLQSRARELNREAARLAREVAAKASRPIIVAGSVGPTGDLLAPLGNLTEEEAEEVFAEQITGLKEGGAHLAWIETMSAAEEMRAAAKAAARLDDAVHLDGELRHGRSHDDGAFAFGPCLIRREPFAVPRRAGRELRGRRLRPRDVGSRHRGKRRRLR